MWPALFATAAATAVIYVVLLPRLQRFTHELNRETFRELDEINQRRRGVLV